jgi:hypothetical protein
MLRECHVTRSVWHYPQFDVTAVALGTYYPKIQGHYCTWQNIYHFFTLPILILESWRPHVPAKHQQYGSLSVIVNIRTG